MITDSPVAESSNRRFSLPVYLAIVCAISWPFQLPYLLYGGQFRQLLLLSMIMAGVGTWVAGRLVFHDAFKDAGFRWGRPVYYLLAMLLAMVLWLLPVTVELTLGITAVPPGFTESGLATLFITSLAITLLPAFGEEFSWRGYLLPRLLTSYSPRQALLIHGLVTWFWHLPFLVVMGMQIEANPLVSVAAVLLISLLPAVMHAIVFAWFWARSHSLAVATFYHAAFDEVRDSLQAGIGFGFLTNNWQMLVLTILGLLLFRRTDWLSK